MRKFLSLPKEKQEKIITAAMTLFGDVGYKKAYISEIAAAAGISKALVFHYFGSKKGLYSYLVYYTGKIIVTEAQHDRETSGKSFFDRVLTIIKFRLLLKSRYPAMTNFINSVIAEDDDEAASDKNRLISIVTDMHAGISLAPGDEKLFKSEADGQHVVNLLTKYAEGVVSSFHKGSSVESAVAEVTECLKILESLL